MPGSTPPPAKVHRTEMDPCDFLSRAELLYADQVAVAHETGRTLTYRELGERSWRLANALRDMGLGRHERVATLVPNSPAALEAHFGVPAAGGVLVTVNTRLASAEVDYILRHSRSRVLIVDRELLPLVDGLDVPGLRLVVVDDTGVPGDPYEALLASASSAERPPSWLEDEEEPISVNYTSGTTGRPKGVVYTHRGAAMAAMNNALAAGLTPDGAYLWTLPMFHCNGWCYPWAVTAVGARHVTLRQPEPGRIWDAIDGQHVTCFSGAPTVHLMVLNHPRAHRVDPRITAMVAAAAPSPTLLAAMEDHNLRCVHVYGLTETYGPFTMNPDQEAWRHLPVDERSRRLARQGQGLMTADLVRVVDDAMRDVPRDGATVGEVVMRGNIVMKEYLDDPEATARAFTGGWFHSGDVAVWHPDGNIELRDRAKDVIISGGENISTIEVEQTICAHPAVLECAVVAIPHDHWGERPKAFVTLRDGASATEREIIDFTRERIAKYKCPDAVAFGPLPKTSTGKVQKFVLREREWAGRETRIGSM